MSTRHNPKAQYDAILEAVLKDSLSDPDSPDSPDSPVEGLPEASLNAQGKDPTPPVAPTPPSQEGLATVEATVEATASEASPKGEPPKGEPLPAPSKAKAPDGPADWKFAIRKFRGTCLRLHPNSRTYDYNPMDCRKALEFLVNHPTSKNGLSDAFERYLSGLSAPTINDLTIRAFARWHAAIGSEEMAMAALDAMPCSSITDSSLKADMLAYGGFRDIPAWDLEVLNGLLPDSVFPKKREYQAAIRAAVKAVGLPATATYMAWKMGTWDARKDCLDALGIQGAI